MSFIIVNLFGGLLKDIMHTIRDSKAGRVSVSTGRAEGRKGRKTRLRCGS